MSEDVITVLEREATKLRQQADVLDNTIRTLRALRGESGSGSPVVMQDRVAAVVGTTEHPTGGFGVGGRMAKGTIVPGSLVDRAIEYIRAERRPVGMPELVQVLNTTRNSLAGSLDSKVKLGLIKKVAPGTYAVDAADSESESPASGESNTE